MRTPPLVVFVAILGSACVPDDVPVLDAGPGSGADWPPAPTLTTFAPCATPNEAFECATLTMALSDDDEFAGLMTLPVMRAPATDPNTRRGVMMFHPGGPGPSPVDGLPGLAQQFAQVVPELHAAFDLVALGQPGTTGSTPLLDCGGLEALADIPLFGALPADEAERALVEEDARALADACEAGSGQALLLASSASTTARTMDALRVLLGEEKLNFLGASYGTFVGATYATLFPDRVGKMVLDSSMPSTRDPVLLTRQLYEGFDDALNEFFAWCGSTTRCIFHKPGGAPGVAAAYDALLTRYDDTPAVGPQGEFVDGALVSNAVTGPLSGELYTFVGDLLAALERGEVEVALAVAQQASLDPQFAQSNLAILGVDFAGDTDFGALFDAAAPIAAAHSRVRGGTVAWPLAWPVATPLALVAPTAPAILVVGGAHDPNTPLENAEPMRAAVGGGSLSFVYEGAGHVQLVRQCPMHAVADWVLLDTPPPASCPSEANIVDASPAGTIDAALVVGDQTRTGETALADFIVDAMRARAGTPLAVMNAGAMRRTSGLPSGVIVDGVADRAASAPPIQLVVGDWYEVLSFGGAIVTRPITGAVLHAVLEHGAGQLPAAANAFIIPSGFRYTVDTSLAAGARVTSVTRDDGTPIPADDTVYDIALDSFISGGNGGFTMLAGVPVRFVETVALAVATSAAGRGALPSTTDGRITIQ